MKKNIFLLLILLCSFDGSAKNSTISDSLQILQENNGLVNDFSDRTFVNKYKQKSTVSMWDLLFLRMEIGNFPSLSIGYGGYRGQLYINGGYGMIGGLIGDQKWGGNISIGGRLSFVGEFNSYENAASMGLRYGQYYVNEYKSGGIYFDAVYSHRNWDYILGFSFGDFGDNIHIFGEDDGAFMTVVLGIGYNFRSKNYWNYIEEKYDKDWGESSTPTVTSTYTNPSYAIPSKSQYTTPCPYHTKTGSYSEYSIKQQIDNENDGIVGIYEEVSSGGYKLGVIKIGNNYRIIYLSGGDSKCWETGHLKAELRSSATAGLFKGTWYMADFSANDNCLITFDGVSMDVLISGDEVMYLKMYPVQESSTTPNEPERWSGTCWAIGNGYMVTNYHVVEGANNITISGVKGDYNTNLYADIIATDNVNDIAILQINDNRFNGFGSIPYSVTTRMADVGEDVFVLGYPLTQTMGGEIKLTNGIISSRTGFQGDVSLYQMSAPIQPGNSGGPLFDGKGNVIGIVVAHHKGAENVGYAIKTSYLKNLIESAGLNIKFPANNTISTLSLTEKVKRIKNFVFYIECSK